MHNLAGFQLKSIPLKKIDPANLQKISIDKPIPDRKNEIRGGKKNAKYDIEQRTIN